MTLMDRVTHPDNPRVFARRGGRRPETRHLVVCAGDSITHGVFTANYVVPLETRLAPDGYQFVNAGISGQLAVNLAARLDEIIACDPDAVVVLIGTNDAASGIDPAWERDYISAQKLQQPPTLELFGEQLERIITRLQAETRARLALIEVPPLGEDLSSRYNADVRRANGFVHATAERHGVDVLPLFEQIAALLPEGHRPQLDPTRGFAKRVFLRRVFLRQSWDRISELSGRIVLADDVHLNDRGAQLLATLVGDWLVAALD